MQLVIDIRISTEEYLKYYKTPSAAVSTRSRDGRSVKFPANILQPFVSHAGIEGSFIIEFSDEGKFIAVAKL
jgi:hypothetical protein